MRVCIGGTFDRLHRGHRALLSRAMEFDEILIGITTDGFARRSRGVVVAPFEERRKAVEAFLNESGYEGRYEFYHIDDPMGPAAGVDAYGIIVSPETRWNAERINDTRISNGLPPLEIIEIGFEMDGIGEVISSSRIRAGEIDTEGKPL